DDADHDDSLLPPSPSRTTSNSTIPAYSPSYRRLDSPLTTFSLSTRLSFRKIRRLFQTKEALAAVADDADKKSAHVKRTIAERQKISKVDPLLESQFSAGRLYAAISSRPGQSGRADGYILEGEELAFYVRKLRAGKAKHAQ
ncbi:hypothetical protein JCM5353_003587, partial [Sporobolomyces roseus]